MIAARAFHLKVHSGFSRQAVVMTKLHRMLLVALTVLGFGLGTNSFAQSAPTKLPADARYNAPVTVDMPSGGLKLETYLKALAASVKLTVVLQAVPDVTVYYDFAGKPFRQVWELVIALNKLDFELQANDVVIVGPPDVISLLRPVAPPPPAPPAPQQEVPKERRAYLVKSDLNAVQDVLKKEFPSATIAALPSSKALLVTATAAQHAEIERLLAVIDLAPAATPVVAPAGPPIVTRVVSLSYTRADSLAEALTKIAQGTAVNGNSASAATLPAGTNAVITQLSVVPVKDSNRIIVSGPQDQVEGLLRLIPQLDVKEALVNVGVRIQEISDQAGRSLGIDWSFGFGNFAGKVLGGSGLNFVLDATRSLAGLNIGAALNALETQRLSKRINDSTLTVLNNGTGSLASGGRIELTATSQGTGGTGTTLASRTLNYGVRIGVSPQVAADGTINMKVKAEVSSIQNPNSVDATRIDFIENSSETTLSMKDSETVVLGTLLQTTQDNSVKGVPILSAIPLIGELFKTRNTTDNQTQLLIVMTVNLVK
jgi:general secretion pathway protein D/type IV pilus assembly protein PilQ